MKKEVTLIGMGGFAKEVCSAILNVGLSARMKEAKAGEVIYGDVIIAFSNLEKRIEFDKYPYNWTSFYDVTSIIGQYVTIGEGSVVMQQVVLTAEIKIGRQFRH